MKVIDYLLNYIYIKMIDLLIINKNVQYTKGDYYNGLIYFRLGVQKYHPKNVCLMILLYI